MLHSNSPTHRSLTCLAIAGILLLLIPGVGEASTFNFVSNPSDPAFTQLLGINNSDTIAGYFGDGTTVPNNGFTLTLPNSFTPENFPGSVQTQVVGINGAGDTVGFYVDSGGVTHGFQDVGNTFTTEDAPGTAFNQILGVNDARTGAGYSSADSKGLTLQRAFIESGNVFAYIDSLLPSGVLNDQATGINDANVISGFFQTASVTDGFTLKGSTLTILSFPGSVFTEALGLNNKGQVVGAYMDAHGVTHGFVFDGTSYTSIDVPGAISTTINGINDNGHIVGFFTDANGNTIGVVGTAVPEPRTSALAAIGILSILLLKSRRESRA